MQIPYLHSRAAEVSQLGRRYHRFVNGLEPGLRRAHDVRAAWIRTCLLLAIWLVAIGIGSLALSLDLSRQRITVAWMASISDVQRDALERSLGLIRGEQGSDGVWNYFLKDRSPESIKRIVTSRWVADTRHIDRAAYRVELDRPDTSPWLIDLAVTGQLALAAWLLAAVAAGFTFVWRSHVSTAINASSDDPGWAIHRLIACGMWVFVFAIAVEYFSEVRRGGNDWRTADWLITYFHGPVRRGMIGTVLTIIADLGFPLKWIVYGVQVLVLAACAFVVIRVYTMRKREWIWLGILYSPAFLLFEYLGTGGALRKETLALLAFAVLCLSYAQQKITHARLIATGALFVVAAFSHEIAAFTLPFFIYVIYCLWNERLMSRRTATAAAAFFIIVSAGAALFANAFRGDAALAKSLCDSLIVRGFDPRICEGTIAWMDIGPMQAFRTAQIDIGAYAWLYLRILALTMLPLLFIRWRGRERAVLSVAGLLSLILLCFMGVDWGRWIHLSAFCLFCVVLAESAWKRIEVRNVPLVVVVLYVVTWSVPLCCEYAFGPGFVSQAYERVVRR